MNKVYILVVLVVTFSWAGRVRADFVIDTFNTTAQSLSAGGLPMGPKSAFSSAVTALGEAIGNERDIFLQRTSANAGSMDADVSLTFAGAFSYASGPATSGFAVLTWDGADGSPLVNPTGLGGMDITQSGANQGFLVKGTSDLGATVVLTVYSDASNVSEVMLPIPADPTFTFHEFFVPFASFAPTVGSGANFTNIGAITLKFDGTSVPGTDGAVDLVVTKIAHTPEPSSIVLIGVGVIGLAGAAYRRRKKSL